MEAVCKGGLAQVNGLLDAGSYLDSEARGGWTALMYAVENGQMGMVQVLLERGADPEAREFVYGKRCSYRPSSDTCEPVPTNGSTALMIAAVNGHVDIVKMLLEAGADPRKENKDGKRALELAEEAGQPGVVALLRETSAPGKPRQRIGESR
jgi:ankyrin repeat protein